MLKNQVLIAIDLETSGKYPLDAEICEVSLIKFQGEKILEKYSALLKTRKPMGEEVIKIHHITNEMVADEPFIEDRIKHIHEFIGDLPLLGHNLPFDLGFLCWEFEKAGLKLNESSHYCTSLLSLALLPKLTSHRLKYLAEYFEVEGEPNHRAEQDALTCMDVFNKLTKEIEDFDQLDKIQDDDLKMDHFSVESLKENKTYSALVQAVDEKKDFELMYSKGSKKNKWRVLTPRGLVLKTKEGSFLVATDVGEIQTKRFMLNKVMNTKL